MITLLPNKKRPIVAVVSLSLLLIIILAELLSANVVSGMPPTPFVCDGSIYISQGTSSISSLYTVDSSTTPFGLNLIDGPEGFQYNSMGYNIINGEIHALVRSTGGGLIKGDFISIDGAGNITNYGQPDVAPELSYSGDVDENGIHYLNKGKTLYAYDTKDPNYPAILAGYPKTMTYSTGADIAYRPADQKLYSITGKKLQIIDPATGTSTQINLTAPAGASYSAISSAGAMWVDASGTVFGYQNSGSIYELNVVTGISTLVSSATKVSTNDGTGCAYAPIFKKSVSPSNIKPGDTLTYQFVIVNGLLASALEYDFEDTLPGDFTYVPASLSFTGDFTATGTANAYAGTQFLSINELGISAAGVATITIQAQTTFDTLPDVYENQAQMTELLPSLGGTKFSDWTDGPEFGDPTPNEVEAVRILTIDKVMAGNLDEDGSGDISVNDTLTYTFAITNDSDLRMYNVTASDPLPGMSGLTCTPPQPITLDPGDGYSCFATYGVTQTDIDNGLISNTASVTGADIGGTTANGSDNEVTATAQNPAIKLQKAVGSVTDADASITFSTGDLVNYTFVLTNTGDTTLESVILADPLPGISAIGCTPAQGSTLGLGASMSCTAVYTSTLTDVNAGDITNTATVTGTTPNGIDVADSSTASVFAAESPDITLQKSIATTVDNDLSGDVSLNDTINYQFVVSNTGNVTLDSISVSDPMAGLSTISCPAGDLAPGVSKTCTATYTVDQDDVDSGSIENTATASGSSPADTIVQANDVATIGVAQNPAFSLTKSLMSNADQDGSGDRTVNDRLTYQFDIVNTGDVRLDNVSVADPLVNPATLSCTPTISSSLPLGESMRCTANYLIVQLDMENGFITNTATATADPPLGATLRQDDQLVIATAQKPAIALDKTFDSYVDADLSGGISVSDTLTFGFVMTNTGNVTLSNVQLVDTQIDIATLVCTPALGSSLGLGATMNCSADHVVTQTERDYGQVLNDATATGVAPDSTMVQDFDTKIVDVVQNPELGLVKAVAGYQDLDFDGQVSVGDTLTYTFSVSNTGDTTLENVRVTDPMTATGLSALSCSPAQGSTLGLGDGMSCMATYPVEQSDIDNGTVNNLATVIGYTPNGFPEDDKSPTSLALNQIPGIALEKHPFTSSGDPNALVLNDVLTYTFTATNTGNVTLQSFTVTDPLPGMSALSCTPANGSTRAPGEGMLCQATYTVTADDIAVGQVSNIASVTGIDPSGEIVEDKDDNTGPSVLLPGVELYKEMSGYVDTDASTNFTVGDVLTYTFDIENTGNTVLFNMQLADPLPELSPLDCAPALGTDVPVNGSIQCTANLTLTQTHFDNIFVINTAFITTTSPLTPTNPITDTASESVPLPQIPFIVLEKQIAANKDEDGSSTISVGDTLTYTLDATNEGNLTLTNVVITDTLEGLSPFICTGLMPATLAPGESLSCLATYSVPQTIGDLGVLSNTGVVTGTAPNGDPVSDDDSVNELIPLMPEIVFFKDASPVGGITIGDAITYTFTATNTGNTTLFGVTISDTLDGLGAIGCSPAQPADLLPNEKLTCTAIYPAVTQEQIDAGFITNFATVTATDPNDNPIDDEATITTELDQAPEITLNKTVAPATDATTGETITFTLTAENSGNTTLSNVIIADSMTNLSGLNCDAAMPATLAFGETLSCTATYVLTQPDVDAGSVSNSGRVAGQDVNGTLVSDTDSAVATPLNSPNLEFEKTVTPADATGLALGDTITYSLVATNTGNVTLSGVTVSDPLPDLGTINCSPTLPRSLAPNASVSCVALYTVSQPDLNAGSLTNIAEVSGIPPSGPTITRTDSTTSTFAFFPSIELEKQASSVSGVDLGETITYTLVATNTGNVTLSAVNISDPLAGLGPLDCSPNQGSSLNPGQALTCSAPYTVTLGNMNSGAITNTATVTGTDPRSTTVSDQANETVTAGQMADLDLTKVATPTAGLELNDLITYTFLVTNVGNVTVDSVVISDSLPGLSALNCLPAVGSSLDPTETLGCTATVTVTQSDIDAGSIFNSATVSGRDPNDNPVGETDTESVPLDQNSDIVLEKIAQPADGSMLGVGDTITYTFTFTNSGNTTLQNVTLTDPLAGLSTPICTPVVVATWLPGDSTNCSAQLTVTQPHLDSGTITNTATVTATDPISLTVSDDDPATVTLGQNPGIILDKALGSTSGSPDYLTTGDVLTYTFTVTNSGNVSLDGVTVTDNLDGLSGLTCSPLAGSSLAPQQAMACQATYTVNITDVLAGQIINTATVFASDPNNNPIGDSDTQIVPPTQDPSAELFKTSTGSTDLDGSGDLSVGDVITYSLVVSNSGNTPLEDVQITDTLPGLAPLTCAPPLGSTLVPATTMVCSTTLTVTQSMLDDGQILNTAGLTTTVPLTTPITITDTSTVPVLFPQNADIDLEKMMTGAVDRDSSGSITYGDTLTYTFTTTNTGNLTLRNVRITDPLLGLSSLSCTGVQPVTLAPLEPHRCTATLTVTQSMVDAGLITNTASVTGESLLGAPVFDSDNETVPIQQTAEIDLVKDVDVSGATQAGDPITYTLTATNTGNVTLGDVVITDPLEGLSALACDRPMPTTLAPQEQIRCTAVYTVTQADFNTGQRLNLATVSATDPNNNPLSTSDPATAVLTQLPNLDLVKTALDLGNYQVGDEVVFIFKSINTGNVTLSNVTISDPFPGLGPMICVGGQPVTLEPGASLQCQASYRLTLADAEAGMIENTATTSGLDPFGSTQSADATTQLPVDLGSDPITEGLTLEKMVNELRAPVAPGPIIGIGDPVSWRYVITNVGLSQVDHISLIDDQEGEIDCPQTSLAPNESMICSISSTSIEGQYRNIAMVTGQPDLPGAETVSAVDLSHYFGSNDPTAVELISFTVTRAGMNSVVVRWETGAEIDNFGFRLLRSGNGQLNSAQQIQFVSSAVTGDGGASYQFIDSNLATGSYSYWLIDVETTGKETVHGAQTITIGKFGQIYLPIVSR